MEVQAIKYSSPQCTYFLAVGSKPGRTNTQRYQTTEENVQRLCKVVPGAVVYYSWEKGLLRARVVAPSAVAVTLPIIGVFCIFWSILPDINSSDNLGKRYIYIVYIN